MHFAVMPRPLVGMVKWLKMEIMRVSNISSLTTRSYLVIFSVAAASHGRPDGNRQKLPIFVLAVSDREPPTCLAV